MKSSVVLALFLSTILFSCSKDQTPDIDITLHTWKLVSAQLDGEEELIVNDLYDKINARSTYDYRRGDDYFLKFTSDSSFGWNTFANFGGGGYEIPDKGLFYGKLGCTTLVEEPDEFNKLNSVSFYVLFAESEYTVKGDVLTLFNDAGEMTFR